MADDDRQAPGTGRGPEPRRLLIDWANKHDSWVRRLASYVISTKKAIGSDETAELFDLFMAEKGFSGEVPGVESQLEYADDTAASTAELRLRKLRDVAGVNALTPGYEIDFSPGLTILFGENGTGKTGYARVLKRLGGVRHAEDIIPDINATTNVTPRATIDYQFGEDQVSLPWSDEVGVAPFTRMSVFDTPAVNLHVDENLSYVYTPADLSLFSYVIAGIRGVQDRVAEAMQDMSGGGNPFLRYFERGTTIYPTIETLGASTDLGALAAFAALPDNAADEKARLEREVAALRANTVENILAGHKDAIRVLETLGSFASAVAMFDRDTYNRHLAELTAVRESYRRVREETFQPGELPGPANDEWQGFVASAARYQEHAGLPDYPHEGDRCIYCRQELDGASVALIRRYATFLDDALARQVADRERVLSSASAALTSIRTETAEDGIRRQKDAGASEDAHEVAERLVAAVRAAQAEASASTAVTDSTLARKAIALRSAVATSVGQHKGAVERLTHQLADRRAALQDSEAKLTELTYKIELSRHLPEIRVYVDKAKRAARLNQLLGRFPGILRSLTEVAKIASEELINSHFEQRFKEECSALRTPKVQLEFVGREGKAQRRKVLASKYRLSQILSEGEQKVLALADFIAEARLGDSSAPIIFDDPVNSLDHRRLEEVARRIATLADARQVVVFTHNIWLATELLARFEKRPDDCAYFSVTDDETTGAKGRIDRAGGPRWDTEKDLGKRVRELLDEAGTQSGEIQIALVESAYGLMRSWCEVVVEQVLFASVTQRYRANIMMGRLKEVRPERLQSAIEVIGGVFDRSCRYISDHSQPLERLGIRPTLTNAQADWQTLQEAVKKYRAS